jgi:hypothetical protein
MAPARAIQLRISALPDFNFAGGTEAITFWSLIRIAAMKLRSNSSSRQKWLRPRVATKATRALFVHLGEVRPVLEPGHQHGRVRRADPGHDGSHSFAQKPAKKC